MTERTSEILNRAADLIEKRGWTQLHPDRGTNANTASWYPRAGDTGPLCLEGGINGVCITANPYIYAPEARAAVDAVANYLGRSPWGRNDESGRTDSEVIAVLRAAALIESAREEQQNAAYATYSENLALVAS